MTIPIILLTFGLVILIFGAEILVRGSASLAKKFGIPPLVIGLTIVAFGTSAPELIVNMYSAYKGSADIAIGNIIGSNIANILLILGICTVIAPLKVKSNTVFKEIPFALLALVLVFTMGNDIFFDQTNFNAITRTDGFSLIAMFAIFMIYTYGLTKINDSESENIKAYSELSSILMTIGGLIFLFIGGKVLVDNAVILAKIAGLSEALIGLTIVAVGTSLPELATSVIATIHHHDDIAIGNIVGSNIFNVFWILGLTATFLQLPFNVNVNFDVLISVIATSLLFLAMFVGKRHRLDRWQGILFLILYVSYTGYLVYRG
ncbi:MAG: calcium/sodium antiporter [Candidatus Buchananbacteria bacterium]